MTYNKPNQLELKVCGMREPKNIQAVANLNPNYLGFIFFERSPRHFTGSIPDLPNRIKKIGVFVNADYNYVATQIKTHDLDGVQLHGKEAPEYCEALKNSFKTLIVIKVFSIKDSFNFKNLKPYQSVCDFFLFDTKGQYAGGNGTTFNWQVLEDYPLTKPYFLSGGIGLNVLEDLKIFLNSSAAQYCQAIDVNSAFETEPGVKDPNQLDAFIKQLNLN